MLRLLSGYGLPFLPLRYVLWAHTAWINIRWVEIHELNEPLNVPLITKEVQVGLEHYSHFNECVDSA